ncbi:MAG TPA: cytochrome c biogenesis protein CcsA [Spirochaetota bacterium]|jgi:ABC-type transport system involved in cytochrome c biogenesis permease subunit|nr:MAG: Cytochrome c biogenesis protein CcsA [Spirochaetes bacterium ADurb.Bin133]HOF01204.1 cytochrome c biogenesis protein CcsA [Spirochaetota bacterium]HOS32851.1 cytochrome c biogenesis protein CcsA [Spirochaetota bacterium]HOS55318.1 cytochrome c biogenesis protein CcsA [Spirochaetota bacterium]HPK61656.1 cytochrome c biogenesis protein CcsA [Spirochaetota bacterium]
MILTSAYCLIIASLASQIVDIFIKFKIKLSVFLNIAAIVTLLLELIRRSILIKYIAITNTYEALIFYSLSIILATTIYQATSKKDFSRYITFIGTIIAFITLSLSSTPLADNSITPPIPALRSNWLLAHVALSFIGESFLAVGFAAAIFYLATKDEEKKVYIEKIIKNSISVGYPIFTIGALLFGAIWAKNAWGRYWGWDPKETFALITFLVYTLYLHLRIIAKTKIKTTVIISVFGFLLTIFTFLGVNLLLPGLHSY